MVASVLLLAAVLVPGLAGADGAWLDGPVTNWNRPGMAIPKAPPRNSASQPQCFDAALKPDSPTTQALVDAGWSIFNATRATGARFEILGAQANADGMCRPTDYQSFVFVSGVFAGTLSPDLMYSRTDGALTESSIPSSDTIRASYVRYTPQDPLCCPSAQSTATFKVDQSGSLPVVVLQSLSTVPTAAASATPPSAAATPPSAAPTATRPSGAAQANCFPETDFCITNPQFADYFAERGGVRILGYPISRSFTLEGFEVQFFQRVVLQMQGGQVARLNLLDPTVMPMTRANQSTFPPPDPALAAQAPPVTSPTYAQDVAAFIRKVAPNTWNGMPVGFYTLFSTTVPVDVAFTGETPNPDTVTLLNLEIWGLPTSNPAADPNNGGFVYQRWQRGIMHFRAEGPVTEGILVGDYFKSVITGKNLPPDLSADMQGSRYLGQYSPGSPGWTARPAELPSTDMTGAFEPGTGPVAAVTPPPAVSTPTVRPTTPTVSTTATATTTTATTTPGALRPTVTIQLDDDAIDPGESVNVTVIAMYPTGIDWIEWDGVKTGNENDNESSSSDPELSRKEHDCNGTANCANVWSVKPTVPGDYILRARARGEDGVTSELVTTILRVRDTGATSTPATAATAAPTSTSPPASTQTPTP
jgi:hypothetical protein